MNTSSGNEPPNPMRGDRLFGKRPPKAPGRRTPLDDLFDWTHETAFPYFARRGYYRASRLIAERIAADREGYTPTEPGLWLPMVFNFRHYVELSLKSLLRATATLASLDLNPEIQKLADRADRVLGSHKLIPLWQALLEIWRAVVPPKDFTEADRAVQDLVQELHDWDPGSTFFRYPTDLKGHAHPQDILPTIDLDRWLDVTERFHRFIEGWDAYLGVLIEQQQHVLDAMPGPHG